MRKYSYFFGHMVGMRKLAHVERTPLQNVTENQERIVYTGCIHGGDNKVYERLKRLLENPPDYLIFSGDITGTAEIEKLKKYFYDEKDRNKNSEFQKYEYFGHFAATLSKDERLRMLSNLRTSAERLMEITEELKQKGTKIYIIEGNWDN